MDTAVEKAAELAKLVRASRHNARDARRAIYRSAIRGATSRRGKQRTDIANIASPSADDMNPISRWYGP